MSKINQILQEWPSGTIITTRWLEERGVSRQLVDSYKKSGWLENFGMGAYKRSNDEITWVGALYTLQKLEGYGIHVGGKTALEQHGLSHYIRQSGMTKVILWKKSSERLPKWFTDHKWEENVVIRSANLFKDSVETYSEKKIENLSIHASTAEQAILELLYGVPELEGWDEVNYIMEGLVSLRPTVLQLLLENCNSIKVKRIFLYLAEKHDHSWFKKLEISKITLGSGRRQIIKGGVLNKRYQITVPELKREV